MADAKARGFTAFDKSTDFDLDDWYQKVPADCYARGMFFQNVTDALKSRGCEPLDGRCIAFKQYWYRDYYDVLFRGAERYCPGEPLALGLYELGHFVYPTFASSMIGKAIFTMAGDMQRVIKFAPRAYGAANNYGKCIVHATTATSAHWTLDDVWDLVPYSVGICRGAFVACGATDVELVFRSKGAGHLELFANWQSKA